MADGNAQSSQGDGSVAIGWVVDDGCDAKRIEGGAGAFAQSIADATEAPIDHKKECPTCQLLGENLACVGLVESPLSANSEEWLLDRLPTGLDSLPGLLLRKHLDEGQIEGKGGAVLRQNGLCEAPGPLSRNYGPFFRRYTIDGDQLLEELFCAGDVQPAHALALCVYFGAIGVDDKVLEDPGDGPKLAEIFEHVHTRESRTLLTIRYTDTDDDATRMLKRYLRALYAAFVLDTEVLVFVKDQ